MPVLQLLGQLGPATLRVLSVHAPHYVHTARTLHAHTAHASQPLGLLAYLPLRPTLGQHRARAALSYEHLLTSQLGQLGLELLEAADDGGGGAAAAPQAGEATPRTIQHPAARLGARAVMVGGSPSRGSTRRT